MTPTVDPLFLAASVLMSRYKVSHSAAVRMLVDLANDSEINVDAWSLWLIGGAAPDHQPRPSDPGYDQTPLGRFFDGAGRRRRPRAAAAA